MIRFLGTETEYGIATPTNPMVSPIITSTHAVVAYAGTAHRTRWDFAPESPLKDSRGFDLRRYHTVPVIDPNALGVANVVLTNGGRFYVDHAHPEYSSPETTNAWDAMIYDLAGDIVMQNAVAAVAEYSNMGHSVLEGHPPCPPLKIYKNNVDGKGASYGAHENYLYHRSTDFDVLAQSLIPFFVCRQIIIGAGRVGLGPHGETAGFQISQRADYIEQQISLETTLNRGIINTRDESHTIDELARLHVIIGDANMSHTAILLKLGMTKLVIDAIEQGVDFSDLAIADPVAEVTHISRDISCTHAIAMRNGIRCTAINVLRAYWERVNPTTDIDRKVHTLWQQILDLLAQDPMSTSHLLDWTAKLSLLRAYESRGVSWSDPKMLLIDLQYSDIDPEKSLFHALVRKGKMVTLASEEQILAAVHNPPADSRAFLRGKTMERFHNEIAAANWDHLTLHNGTIIDLLDPSKGTQQLVGALLENAQSAVELSQNI
ncbi:depupylase/deamidase Dop [Corynebacterium freiburgense]|uniref:depupylase/deamidase Dop n=1 Tax=Corynebacterium freiburgense TaxID=556548 RepID=UPI000415BC55|nr:depupylase/deamidase Dop [Corynebacterium freiburgense]WJZ02638.1 Pup deamidase/depupylase [Corynebacterium freiburgense]